MAWNLLLILFLVALVLDAVGFYKYVYFLSVGYGFSVAGCGIATLILALSKGWTGSLLWLALLQTVLFVAYGARLSGFLVIREFKNKAYQKVLSEATKKDRLPIFVAATIWVFCAALYAMQVSPMLYRWFNGSTDVVVPVIGMLISAAGLVLESVSDKQKSAQKAKRPDMVATEGLFKMCRCPNYFGEITFWTGVFVAGITTYANVGQWIMAIVAYVCIVFIMFNGAQRLEKRQNGRYGEMEEYRKYADSTPIIIPFLPIYHLNK